MSYPDQVPETVRRLIDREAELRQQYARARDLTADKRGEVASAPRRYDQQVADAIAAGTDTAKVRPVDVDRLQQEAAACARAEADLQRQLEAVRREIGETVAACWDDAVRLADEPVAQATQRLAELEAEVEAVRADLRRHLLARRWVSEHQYPRSRTGTLFGAQRRPGWGRAWQPTPDSLQELRDAEARIAALWANHEKGTQAAEQRRLDYEEQQRANDERKQKRRALKTGPIPPVFRF